MEEVELVEREVFIEKIQDGDVEVEVEVVVVVERERYFEEIQMEGIYMPDKPSLAYYKNEFMKLSERVKSAEKNLKNLKNSHVFNRKSMFPDRFNPLPTYEAVR